MNTLPIRAADPGVARQRLKIDPTDFFSDNLEILHGY
jgi:hypothetical protein